LVALSRDDWNAVLLAATTTLAPGWNHEGPVDAEAREQLDGTVRRITTAIGVLRPHT
jgi:hypothetical protein